MLVDTRFETIIVVEDGVFIGRKKYDLGDDNNRAQLKRYIEKSKEKIKKKRDKVFEKQENIINLESIAQKNYFSRLLLNIKGLYLKNKTIYAATEFNVHASRYNRLVQIIQNTCQDEELIKSVKNIEDDCRAISKAYKTMAHAYNPSIPL